MFHSYQFQNKVYTTCLNCGLIRIKTKVGYQYWLNGTLYDYEPVCHVVSTEGESLLDPAEYSPQGILPF